VTRNIDGWNCYNRDFCPLPSANRLSTGEMATNEENDEAGEKGKSKREVEEELCESE
jgi:hypothetical protein